MNIVLLEPLAVSADVLERCSGKLVREGHSFRSYPDRTEDPVLLSERARGSDIAIIANIKFPAEVIRNCPDLKMISVAFTGVDHVDLKACRERGITVCNSAGYSTDSVAELVVGQILMRLRNLSECDRAVRSGKTKDGLVGNTLKGKTVGIVGTGSIGLRTAEILKAFGCSLLGWSRSERKEAKALGISYVPLDELFSKSDIVSLHLPLTEKTSGLVGISLLSRMKKNAILVNASRGPVVDSRALAGALDEGLIKGACIDVFENEPPIDKSHPLLSAKGTVLSPHVAFATEESFALRADIVFGNIEAWLSGRPVNIVS